MLKQFAVDAEYETYEVSNAALNTVPQHRAETLRNSIRYPKAERKPYDTK